MVVELAAVRLLAPWFGTSLLVWTNVIAVILLALALGYLIGGRLAARPAPLALLSWLLGAAALLVAWLPTLGAACARLFLPPQLALHEAVELVGWGSLAVALIVFLPPAALLGTVSPLVAESLARARGDSAGRAGGLVLSVSTLGSLAGVFGTSHWLLPVLGLQRTFLLAGAGLLGAALSARLQAGRGARAGLVVLALLGASAAAVTPARPALAPGLVELARVESPYQTVRAVEDRERGLRLLQVNESFDSFQSVWQASPGPLPEGFYYNDFLLPLRWADSVRPWRMLVLGLGAGTVVRVFEGAAEVELESTGVELDPAVVRLAEQHFDLRSEPPRRAVWAGIDARVALRVAPGPFEHIVLDCYSNQIEIPPHLCTREFFEAARARLAPGGWLTANLGGFSFDDPVVRTVAGTCATAFAAPVLLVRVPQSRNFVLLARRDASLPWSAEHGWSPSVREGLPLGPRVLPGFACLVPPLEDALSDDRCPIERLQLRSLREARARHTHAAGGEG